MSAQSCWFTHAPSPQAGEARSAVIQGDLDGFLRSVQSRAFRMAEFALRDREDALDVVQEAMLALARRYADRPAEEWPPLFWRILSSRITDVHRRRGVRRRVTGWLSRHDDDDEDRFEQVPAPASWNPDAMLLRSELSQTLLDAIRALPLRQQQAFLLRSWEGLGVEDTARAMGCSGGSVKTHYFRALRALRSVLGAQHDDP